MAKSFTLPYNLEAERAVLGTMLLDAPSVAIGVASLTEESFSDVDKRHRLIFRAIQELYTRRLSVDPQTVYNELKSLKLEKDAEAPEYLFQLVNSVVAPENMNHYVKIVRDHAVLRDLLVTMNQIQTDYATGGIPDINDFVMNANNKIAEIANKRSVGNFQSAQEVIVQVREKINTMAGRDRGDLTGIDTGYSRLNLMTKGWQKEELIIVAGRPSTGKTALALNFAINAAIRTNQTVGFFSLEMSDVTIMQRILSARACVAGEHIQTGMLTNDEKLKLNDAMTEVAKTKLYIDSTPNALLGDITAKATTLKARFPDLCLIVVDYMGIIRTNSGGRNYSREQEVALISSSLKMLARQLHVPVIVVCQLNRQVDSNEGAVPRMSNLRESGSIEQDADMIILLHRSDYETQGRKKPRGFNPQQQEEQPKPKAPSGPGDISTMHVNLAKNRNGKTGKIHLMFSKAYSRFDDPTPEYEEELAEMERRQGGDLGD
ncbi:MAG: replicative DNA helicase [Bacilli bacterium]|nr:replicative DNA helicase [Bacilli bacterium]